MQKRYIVAIVILIVGVILAFSIKPIFNLVGDSFWDFISTQLDREERERQQKMENGEMIRGKDTVLIWENKFEIWHHIDEKRLSIENNGVSQDVMKKIRKHKIFKEKLYVLSDEGYAVIDKNNLCRVFITVSPEEFTNGYTIDPEGIQHPMSRLIKDEHIQYLNSYEDFNTEEKAVFEKMK